MCYVRIANRVRQNLRPYDPRDLDFDMEESHLPDTFLVSEFRRRNESRHIILATQEQLKYLRYFLILSLFKSSPIARFAC